MSERAKVFVIAHLPAGLEREFLQHVRNFDVAHADCHFEMGVEGPDLTIIEMVERLRVNPALTFTEIFERKGEGQAQRAPFSQREMDQFMSDDTLKGYVFARLWKCRDDRTVGDLRAGVRKLFGG